MGTIIQKLQKLMTTKAQIKQAIIEMGQQVGDVFSTYPDKIRAIQSGLDTDDATATANDIAYPATAYVKGQKITGKIAQYLSGGQYAGALEEKDIKVFENKLNVFSKCISDVLIRTGSIVFAGAFPLSDFGTASASDVISGKTFTSASGFQQNGTLRSIPSGTGINVPFDRISAGTTTLAVHSSFSENLLMSKGSLVTTNVPLSNFGNATASDVVSGKTFTSYAGVKITGTYSSGGSETGTRTKFTIDDRSGGGNVFFENKAISFSTLRSCILDVMIGDYLTINLFNNWGSIGMEGCETVSYFHSTDSKVRLIKITGIDGHITFSSIR